MRSFLKKMLVPTGRRERRILFGPAAGTRMALDLQDEFRIWLGLYEAELNGHFRRLVFDGARCFDVGGAEGYHAVMLAACSGTAVVSFEPGAEWQQKIRDELSRNGLDGEVVKAFVGAEDGDGMISIDTAATRYFVPDLIKMDIEGAEAAALRGAAHVLATHKPHLIIEVHGLEVENDCRDLLEGHGYTPQVIEPRTWLSEYRPIAHNRWLVCEGDHPVRR